MEFTMIETGWLSLLPPIIAIALALIGIEDKGIFTAAGAENGSEAKLSEIREFAKTL